MKFRLVLRGPLPPDKRGKADVKQQIRRELHPQLRHLWRQHPALKHAFDSGFGGKMYIEMIGDDFDKWGFRFIPLVQKRNQMSCSLDILILRREEPHRVFSGAGDLDGRVKTLIDGLRMPQQRTELGKAVPSADETPFFCLLEDDGLIFDFRVTTDRLLVPPGPKETERDIVAVVGVHIKTEAGAEIATFGHSFYERR